MEPIIYNIAEKHMLGELLDAFYSCIGLNIELLDENGNVLESRGTRPEYCRSFSGHLVTGNVCREIHASAGRRAMKLGEAYIFSCHSNLSHIAFPLMNNDQLFGSIMVGPFLMDGPNSSLVLDVGKRYPSLSAEDLMVLYDCTTEIPVVDPAKVTQISKLLYYLFSNLLTDSKERFIVNQNKVHQQAKISESIHMMKSGEHAENIASYPIDKEAQLMIKVREGNLEVSRTILNDILGQLLLSAGSDADVMRNRSIELCSMLSRTAIASGASEKQVFDINDHFLAKFRQYNTVEDLCYALEETLYSYIECMFPITGSNGSKAVREAMRFISSNFSENITLSDVAGEVFLNENYFSRLFHESTGMTFKDYLTKVRMEEAKRLLKSTEFPLLEIAIAIGYDNQSYFSRVFKAYTGMSPSQYRLS